MATSSAVLTTVSEMQWPFEIAQILESAMQDPKIYPHRNIKFTSPERASLFARIAALKKKPSISVQDQAELLHTQDTVSRQFRITDFEFLRILFHYDQSTSNRDLLGKIVYNKSRSYCGDEGQFFVEGGKETAAQFQNPAQREFVSYWTAYQCLQSFLKTLQSAQKLSSLPPDPTFAPEIEKTSPSIEVILLAAEPLFEELERFADQTLKLAVNKLEGKYSILPQDQNYRPDLRIVELVNIGKRQIAQLKAAFESDELRASLDSLNSREVSPPKIPKSSHSGLRERRIVSEGTLLKSKSWST